jgi:hypothetical protein
VPASDGEAPLVCRQCNRAGSHGRPVGERGAQRIRRQARIDGWPFNAEPFQSRSNLGGRNLQLPADRPGAEPFVDVLPTEPRRIGEQAATTLPRTCRRQRQTSSVQPVADRSRSHTGVCRYHLYPLAGVETGDNDFKIRRGCHGRTLGPSQDCLLAHRHCVGQLALRRIDERDDTSAVVDPATNATVGRPRYGASPPCAIVLDRSAAEAGRQQHAVDGVNHTIAREHVRHDDV